MARKQKSLEEQLALATDKRDKAKIFLQECEEQITSIKHQIEDRNMRDMYSYVKEAGITIEDIKTAFETRKKKTT